MFRKRILIISIIFIFAVSVSLPLWVKISVFDKIVYSGNDSISFTIRKNSTLSEITDVLRQSGFDITYFEFKATSKWFGYDNRIRHGEFRYYKEGTTSVKELIEFLTKHGTLTLNVTIPEGSRINDIAGIVSKAMDIDSALFVRRTAGPALLEKFGVPGPSLEGYLYPETYNFNKNDNIDDIIFKMYQTFRSSLSGLEEAVVQSGYTLHEIITLASIIQGEVMNYDEISDISAVYNNRLKKNMLLQADPTIQYIIEKPRRLLFKDLSIDNPYNTYIYKGLPPGPINNPSLRAVRAALEPSDKKYLYMVAKGDGSHFFNYTLEDHLRDKSKLDEIRKNIKKNKK